MAIDVRFGTDPRAAITVGLDSATYKRIRDMTGLEYDDSTPTAQLSNTGTKLIVAGLLRADFWPKSIASTLGHGKPLYRRDAEGNASPSLGLHRLIARVNVPSKPPKQQERTLNERSIPPYMWQAGIGALALSDSLARYSKRFGWPRWQRQRDMLLYNTPKLISDGVAGHAIGRSLGTGGVTEIVMHSSSYAPDGNPPHAREAFDPTTSMAVRTFGSHFLSAAITAQEVTEGDGSGELRLRSSFNSVDPSNMVVRPHGGGDLIARMAAMDAALRLACTQ